MHSRLPDPQSHFLCKHGLSRTSSVAQGGQLEMSAVAVRELPGFGRAVVALRDLSIGEVIFNDLPILSRVVCMLPRSPTHLIRLVRTSIRLLRLPRNPLSLKLLKFYSIDLNWNHLFSLRHLQHRKHVPYHHNQSHLNHNFWLVGQSLSPKLN